MDNSYYNSLTEQLIEKGILKGKETEEDSLAFENVNFFEKQGEDIQNTAVKTSENNKRRLNMYELETNNETIKKNQAKTNPLSKKESFLIRFFPTIYKAYLAKCALKELTELNIDTVELLDKTIPYGESESRYKNLIKYLKFANNVQRKIKSKFN